MPASKPDEANDRLIRILAIIGTIVVALIGLLGIVLASENGREIVKRLFPEAPHVAPAPTPIALVPLSPDSIWWQQSSGPCTVMAVGDREMFSSPAAPNRRKCSLVVANYPRYTSLGYLEGTLRAEGNLIGDDTSIALRFQSTLENRHLNVLCGLSHKGTDLFSLFYIYIQTGSDPQWDELVYERVEQLNAEEAHVVRLTADATTQGLFRCFVDSKGLQYRVNESDFFIDNDLRFERHVVVDYGPNSTADYVVGNLVEFSGN